jgi:amino acid transporter/nucleotide-binding universal stress UspA family protein
MADLPLPGDSSSVGGRLSDTSRSSRLRRATQVIVVGSVMFTFISYWRTAAVVLCDLASTAYYIGGIVEQSIGPAAPWFILAVMCFSYAVRSVYIESCALFVRGGVYRVVKEAMGGFLAKLSVSALMFDYILTGPISGVSAGQYLIGLALEMLRYYRPELAPEKDTGDAIKAYGSAAIACLITLYFFRQNLIGIHESSEKAFRIMQLTTVMAAVMLVWCAVTFALQGPAPKDPNNPDLGRNTVPFAPDFQRKMNYDSGKVEDPLGFISATPLGDRLRAVSPMKPPDDPGIIEAAVPAPKQPALPYPWLSLVGLIGLAIAFGHSILAMSGEETLAQVYREVESPKLQNFRRAAFVVFVYSLCLTATISFFAVLLIPESVRMPNYSGNLIGGLAMNVMGPHWARLALNGFVVVVGFLILAGAVNTAIIGSNGVLNRVAEDGVLPDWLLRPHPKYGTTYRVLYLILGLQLATIFISRGDVITLGEAYAFGVVWSFVFKALSMVVLRFKQPGHRDYKVPLNVPLGGGKELPVGLILIFAVLLTAAAMNLLTKETATIWGLSFTAAFLTVFVISERVNLRKHPGTHGHHEHLEQFNVKASEEVTSADLGLSKQYTKLVAIRSPYNLFMLEKALAETDPDTTSVVVMTAKVVPDDGSEVTRADLDRYDQQLMTAVVERAEKAGKKVKPLIVPTNNPLHAILKLAQELNAQEIIIGASNKYPADVQLDQIALYWMNLNQGEQRPLTVRLLSRDRDIYLDLAGGNRIPHISERQAKSVAELRAAGVGVDRVMLVHDGSRAGSDLFQAVLTMLDPQVALALAYVPGPDAAPAVLRKDHEKARNLGRELAIHPLPANYGAELVQLARESQADLLILPRPAVSDKVCDVPSEYVLRHAHCPVFLATAPAIPEEAAAE